MSEEKKRRPYVPPEVSSEIVQDLSAGGCGKCPTAGVDATDCTGDPFLGAS